MSRFGIGQAIRRVEDQRFLTGAGRFTDDIALPGQLCGLAVRSPHAHAQFHVKADAARAVPGVRLVLTADDIATHGLEALPGGILPKGAPEAPLRPVLPHGVVRHGGEMVAFVVADSLDAARDGAEALDVTYAPLPANADPARAGMSRRLWDSHPDNLAFDHQAGDAAAVARAMAKAARLVRIDLAIPRLAPVTPEPRCCLAEPFPDGSLVLYTPSQGVHEVQATLTHVLGRGTALRVISPDVGGGFGARVAPCPEQALALLAARLLGRPVKWTAGRSDSFVGDAHACDSHSRATLALDGDGRFLALRVESTANLGAYAAHHGSLPPSVAQIGMLCGCYEIPTLHARVKGVFTNTVPVDADRGGGRAEAAYLIERLADAAGRETGLGPVEIRRRNFIAAAAMPRATAGGKTYDSGQFERLMSMAMTRADWDGFARRRAASAERGRRRGIGLACYVDISGGSGGESATVACASGGTVEILVGTQCSGQGHETAFAQMVAAELGYKMEQVRLIQGDTARIATGGGSSGSRSLSQQGGAIARAVEMLIVQGRAPAARLLRAAPEEVRFAGGAYGVRDRSVRFAEVVRDCGGMEAAARFKPQAPTFPNGCHVCELETDPETGVTEIQRYTIVDDMGVVLNPLLLRGQIIGGAVHGIGRALFERLAYDPDSARLLNGSLDSYARPHARAIPPIELTLVQIPCRTHPLGIKGASGAGAVGAPPAVINALLDALAPLGVRTLDMPATPLAVWSAIAAARRG